MAKLFKKLKKTIFSYLIICIFIVITDKLLVSYNIISESLIDIVPFWLEVIIVAPIILFYPLHLILGSEKSNKEKGKRK